MFFIGLCSLLSQEQIASFSLLGKEMMVKAEEPDDKGDYWLYIDGYPLGSSSSGGVYLSSKKIEKILIQFKEIRTKYIEWTSTAKENNITDFSKEFSVDLSDFKGYFDYGGWHVDGSISPSASFVVTESEGNISYCVWIYTNAMQSSSNQYIDTEKGFVFPFYSLDELDNFISLFDKDLVDKNFDNKQNIDNLFKD